MSLVDQVLAAKAKAEAAYSAQTESGTPLNAAQQAEVLIAQVQAIIAGETLTFTEEPKA